MLVNNGSDKLPLGSYMRNDGNMNFKFIKSGKGSNIKFVKDSQFSK